GQNSIRPVLSLVGRTTWNCMLHWRAGNGTRPGEYFREAYRRAGFAKLARDHSQFRANCRLARLEYNMSTHHRLARCDPKRYQRNMAVLGAVPAVFDGRSGNIGGGMPARCPPRHQGFPLSYLPPS